MRPRTIYAASRASIPERAAMWRRLRADGAPIISTWIDEAGEGETENFTALWRRIHAEIVGAGCLIFYAAPEDFPVKGALVEVGIALAAGVPVIACLPGVQVDPRNARPVGSWLFHPGVARIDDLLGAVAATRSRRPS